MDHVQRGLRVSLFVAVMVMVGSSAAAGEVVTFQAGPSGVSWQPLVPFEHGILTVSAPDGVVFQEEFKAGGRPAFSPFAQPGYSPPDGTYVWQVTLGRPSAIHPALRDAAKANRGQGDIDIEAAYNAAATRATQVQSGAFLIERGAIVPSNLVEPGAGTKGSAPSSAVPDPFRQAEWLHDDPSIRQVDQVIADDLIVQGSLCVGFDCVNNESFGFDTIRMKENNTRIKFEDTSVGSFPTNDWQLTANESASGGASKFSIEDITGARVPFTIRAGAATNSIFVDSTGRLGLRTATPVLDVHVNTSNTPAHRLEQNNSGGFVAQTWDVAGNEANFFVRDVTGGSRLPFRIRPGAPTSSLDISASGEVGIGTASPDGLQINVAVAEAARSVDNVRLGVLEGTPRLILEDSGSTQWEMDNNAGRLRLFNPGAERFTITSTGNVGIGTAAPANPLQMASGAHVTAGGVWTDASSRELKQDIRELTPGEALNALVQIAPVRYASRIDPTEQHVGFIAEDVPDLVATRDRKALSPMDIVAVLTRVVQEQQKTVEAQQKAIAELTSKLKALEAAQDSPRSVDTAQ